MATDRQAQVSLDPFLRSHEVFSLDDLTKATAHPGGKKAVRNALSYHVRLGRVKSVTRGVYATVPPQTDPKRFQPDRFLVAAKVRPDAVFSHHAALELLGAAHSDWSVCTVLSRSRRPPIQLGTVTIRFLLHPSALKRRKKTLAGTTRVTRSATALQVTGPERTLLDGLRQPELAGGPAELVDSAAGFGVLDLKLLLELLELYQEKLLWAAAGWFLERHQEKFFVPFDYLDRLRRHRPRSPQYLLRSQRGGSMAPGWNLILPPGLSGSAQPDEP